MRIKVLYFAAVRDVTGLEEEDLDLPERVSTAGDFMEWLVLRWPALGPATKTLRLARNEAFAEPSTRLAAGDTLAVIPPVAGG